MVMSLIWTGILCISLIFAALEGRGNELSGAIMSGSQAGIALAISMGGAICLWTGVGKLMEHSGITQFLAKCLRPFLHRVFPDSKKDKNLAGSLSANICANFLGLGNAATPMGIQAVKQMRDPNHPTLATDQMCRLIVLNTASIQLIPSTVAAVRASLGCATPFDILPAVWITSLCSAGLGLLVAIFLGRMCRHA